jgi:hypothetical protein
MRPKGKLLALLVMFAAVGLITATGAFTTVEAERTADVNVQGDGSALLALNGTDSTEFAEQSGNELAITLDDGSGVNLNATTAVLPDEGPLFNATNNGGQTVNFTIQGFNAESNTEVYFIVNDGETTGNTDLTGVSSGVFNSVNYEVIQKNNTATSDVVSLTPGDSVSVGIVIVTEGNLSPGNDIFTDDTITITADATS